MGEANIARCFVALEIDDASLRASERAQRLLDAQSPAVRKTGAESMHLTIKFLGDVDIDAIGRPLLESLRALVEASPAPPLGEGRLDAFPSAGRAHVVVLLATDPTGAIGKLAARADEVAAALGIAREARAFRPHLTLGRSKRSADVRSLVDKTPAVTLGNTTRLVLFRSDRDDHGSRYTAIAHADYAPAALIRPRSTGEAPIR